MNSVVLVLFIAGAANALFLPKISIDPVKSIADISNNLMGSATDMMDMPGAMAEGVIEAATNIYTDMMQTGDSSNSQTGSAANMIGIPVAIAESLMEAVTNMMQTVDGSNSQTGSAANMIGIPVEIAESVIEAVTNINTDIMQTFLDKLDFSKSITNLASIPLEIWNIIIKYLAMLLSNYPVSFPSMSAKGTEWMDMWSKMFNVNMNLARDICWSCVKTCNKSETDPHVSFQLFTDTQGNYRNMDIKDEKQCPNSNYPVIIIIHDYAILNPKDSWINKINVEYQRSGTYNIIAVNWTNSASEDYVQSAANTYCVGKRVAKLIQYLFKCNISCKNIHIIGYGMGGHVAGVAGKEIKLLSSNVCIVGRITGLDLSGPYFEHCDCSRKLCKDDGGLVDLIQTDGKCLGTTKAIGTANFIVNGGGEQPGCTNSPYKHQYSIILYKESINNKTILGYKCPYFENQMQMCQGAETEILGPRYTGKSGIYQVTTDYAYDYNYFQ